MTERDDLTRQLTALMLRAAPAMVVALQGEGGLSLNAPFANPLHPKQPLWFGGVRPGKAYVSYHLMPVYSHPALLEGISPALRRRMQGKSCFNFKKPDPDLMAELEALTAAAAELYARPFTIERIDGQSVATPAPSGPADN
ncbi:MAG: hypothetical protein QE280_11870 [Caulobacter sp.]|nr:hypothetical protein [Caulobacter sp.]